MFTGRIYNNLEAKGRLAIPVQFRKELGSGGVITWGLDGCLFLFPDSYWQQLTAKLSTLSLTNSTARNLTRLLVQSATPLNMDRQGRTLIPEHLRDQAKLNKEVVVAGSLTRIEIWDREAYHKHLELITEQFATADEALAALEI